MKRETIKAIGRGVAHILPDVLLIIGGLLVAAGVYMIYPPVGVIVLGGMIFITGMKVA